MATKKFMYLNRKAPYGTVYALESLEVVLPHLHLPKPKALSHLYSSLFLLKILLRQKVA
jgi:tRNA 2-thiouridine synthesizing protein C